MPQVGDRSPRYYDGTVTTVTAPDVTVRCADDDGTGQPLDFTVRGTAVVNERVTVMVPANGRPVLIRS